MYVSIRTFIQREQLTVPALDKMHMLRTSKSPETHNPSSEYDPVRDPPLAHFDDPFLLPPAR